tara:strand:- start:1334 stop:1453 length:120 start_codon:yes stop_codon:yes gene_type:complete
MSFTYLYLLKKKEIKTKRIKELGVVIEDRINAHFYKTIW